MNSMIQKISLFLAKILCISTLVIFGSLLILPNQTQATTTDADYAHLTFTAKDPNGVTMTDVHFYIYEQLADMNGQPVIGAKLANGYIDGSGIDRITVKNLNKVNYNIAVVFYKNSKTNEKFTLWNEYIYGTFDRSYLLRFSSAKIILEDQNHNLLRDKSFSLYSAGIDAQGNKVANKLLYSGQKTGALGYKLYYLIPGDYMVRVDKDYLFTITNDNQADVNLIIPQYTTPLPAADAYAILNFIARDPNNAVLTDVHFYVYEQLTDISGQPVFGDKLGSGHIDSTGLDTIKIKNSNGANIKIAILYYINSRDYEKFTLWNQYIYGTASQNYILRFSSAKIILQDQNKNLLKDQSFGIYSTGIDALGNKVANKRLYSGQKTGALGYKIYYFVPGDYMVRIEDKDYSFSVSKETQTLVIIIFNPATAVHPATATKTTATINLVAKDPQGVIVNKVSYAVYEQLKDANNNPVLGKKLTSGSITDTGFKAVTLKNTVGNTINFAIVYYQTNNEFGKFYLYNQSVTGNEVKEIRLPFSGVKISIAEPGAILLPNYDFSLYAVIKDSGDNNIGSKKVLSSQETDELGYKTLYLVPGDYFITVEYMEVNDAETLGSTFKINTSQLTNFVYSLGAIKVTFIDSTKDTNKTSFKLFKYSDGEYFSVGSFTTDDNGTKRVVLPAGEYRLDSKISNSQYEEGFEFLVPAGNERSFTFSKGTFNFRVVDGYRNPLSSLKVSIYNYSNSKGSKAYSDTTNSNGEIIAPLDAGSYIAYIDTAINGQKFNSRVFYVQGYFGSAYEYVVSTARIYLQDNKYNNLVNQKFYLYNYALDNNGNVITGKELGNYVTNNFGYYDIPLLAGRYIVKPVNATKIFPILVETEKLNTFYLTAVINPDYVEIYPPVVADTTRTITTPATNTVFMASIYTNPNLYDKDSDGDTLADFEEKYIWRTDPLKADTDGDKYKDGEEIRNGWDPNGPARKTYTIWAYEKPRVYDLAIEQKEATYLKAELTRRLGYAPNLSAANWNTLIKAFVYGGYNISEIQHTVQYGPAMVHPTIPAYKWRVMRTQ